MAWTKADVRVIIIALAGRKSRRTPADKIAALASGISNKGLKTKG
jgi:hypothetical protein